VPIYLDHAATTPMSASVIAAYASALSVVGNPSSIHSQGQNAKRMLEEARERIAESIGADPVEVTFTSGGTESINLAIKGLFWSRPGNRILSTRAEHHATLDSLEWLAAHEGAVIDWIPVDAEGRIDLAALSNALGPDVVLVTTLLANNEVGTIQPIAEIVAIAAAHGVPVHCDAVGAYGQVPIDFHASGLAALSLSAHKVGGPVGVGALVIARSATVTPLIHGGNQQRARSGTQDVAGAVGFAAAASSYLPPAPELRDRLIAGVLAAVPDAVLRGAVPDAARPAPGPAVPAGRAPTPAPDRLPGNAHFTFRGCEGDSLLFLLDAAGFSVSTGSACQAGVPEASHVLLAMGLDEPTARGALRFTLGHDTTEAEVDGLVAALPAAVEQARTAGYADRVTILGR
jgi:cysteine desulfurase